MRQRRARSTHKTIHSNCAVDSPVYSDSTRLWQSGAQPGEMNSCPATRPSSTESPRSTGGWHRSTRCAPHPCAGGSWRPSGLLSAVVLCPRPAPSTPRAALCSRWRTTPTAMRRSGNQWRSHPMAASTPVLKLSEIWLPGREPSIASTGKACDGVSRKIATPCADPATAAPWPDDAPAIAHPE